MNHLFQVEFTLKIQTDSFFFLSMSVKNKKKFNQYIFFILFNILNYYFYNSLNFQFSLLLDEKKKKVGK